MKPVPIFIVLRRIERLSLPHKASHLKALIDNEPFRSIRRGELEAALKQVILRQLKRECRKSAA